MEVLGGKGTVKHEDLSTTKRFDIHPGVTWTSQPFFFSSRRVTVIAPLLQHMYPAVPGLDAVDSSRGARPPHRINNKQLPSPPFVQSEVPVMSELVQVDITSSPSNGKPQGRPGVLFALIFQIISFGLLLGGFIGCSSK